MCSFVIVYHAVTMSDRSDVCLRKNLLYFKLLSETDSSTQRLALLKTISPSQLRILSEVSNHLLTKHCKLNRKTRKKLRKKIKVLKNVGETTDNYKRKKKTVTQHGKGLSKLIPIIGSIVESIFS